MDNASANNATISYLSRGLSVWNGHTLLNGEFMHMWCSTHMKEIDSSISKIRDACKFVRYSPSRLTTFKKCAKEVSDAILPPQGHWIEDSKKIGTEMQEKALGFSWALGYISGLWAKYKSIYLCIY